jgi:hypothetical protein
MRTARSSLDLLGVLFAIAALVLVPWVVFLVRMLPSDHPSAHWDVAWGGFDIALALLLLGVAVAAWRRSPWLEGVATAAASLLFADAWFDVLTSSTHAELVTAIIEAATVELPLAAVCLLLARAAKQRLQLSPPNAREATLLLHAPRPKIGKRSPTRQPLSDPPAVSPTPFRNLQTEADQVGRTAA